ncbi:uncharacterized protein LOC118508952 [Anopheles stephensi]|uniref:uncharacterized protein LOC118508952 n=1 Tax=Anopheles stephensi TaxID=30069 RepID=UPI0016587418|nr:uncharacterized protein LOC118508952 [Anopheles stephensi]
MPAVRMESPYFIKYDKEVIINPCSVRQKLVFYPANIGDREWTICAIYEKGKVDMAVMLNCTRNNCTAGVWAGLKCELVEPTIKMVLKSSLTKLHYIRPGKTLRAGLRVWPERLFNRRSNEIERPMNANSTYICRLIITQLRNVDRERLQAFLDVPSTIAAKTPVRKWCIDGGMPNCMLRFANGFYGHICRWSLLYSLDESAPLRNAMRQQPYCREFVIPLTITQKVLMAFMVYLNTNALPREQVNEDNIYGLLEVAKYVQAGDLIDLCVLHLSKMASEGKISRSLLNSLPTLHLPAVTEIIRYSLLATLVIPEIASDSEDDNGQDA